MNVVARPRVWLILVAAMLILLGGILLGVTRHRGKPSMGSASAADVSIGHFTMFRTRAGRVEWEVVADRAEFFEQESFGRLHNVRAVFHRTPTDVITVVGDEGRIDTRTRDFWMTRREGPMVLRLSNGMTVEAKTLQWEDEAQALTSPDPVRLVDRGLEIHGQGLRANMLTQEWEIVDGVQARIVE